MSQLISQSASPVQKLGMERRKKLKHALIFIALAAASLLFLMPVWALVLAAMRPGQELMRFGITFRTLIPTGLTLEYILDLSTARNGLYYIWFRNSIAVVALRTSLTLALTSFVGYGLAVYDFKGRKFLLTLVVLLLVVPIQILILPLYQIMINFGLMNTLLGVVLPFAVLPFAIFFFHQYAHGLPTDLIDAGRIDGMNEFGIFFRIMLPLMIPAIGAMAILVSLQGWNDFLWPLVVLRTENMFTIPIGLSALLTPYEDNYDMLLSGALMATLPIMVLFFLFQRYFVSGLSAGSVKG